GREARDWRSRQRQRSMPPEKNRRERPMTRARTMLCASLLLAAAAALPAQAQSVAEFYRGKTVNVLIGVGVGGEYDLQARLVARPIRRHIPRHTPGVPQKQDTARGTHKAA